MTKPESINWDQIGDLAVDENNRLYWAGKPIVTEERIVLSRWVNIAIALGALATVTLAIIEVLRYLKPTT